MNADRNNALLLLAEKLLSGDPTLKQEIDLAINQPADYVSRFQERLRRRGLKEAVPSLPWIALVDGLQTRGRVAEIDWDEAPDDVVKCVDRLLVNLPADPKRWTWVEMDVWEESPTVDFLKAIGERLAAQGWVLFFFDMQSDNYPLMLLHTDQFESAQQLAAQAGYGIMRP